VSAQAAKAATLLMDLRILDLFQIFKIPLLSTSVGHAMYFDFFVFSSVAVQIYICESILAGKVAAHSIACRGT
jgi:hypothetical protein